MAGSKNGLPSSGSPSLLPRPSIAPSPLQSIRFDLGLRTLVTRDWRPMFSAKGLREDLVAGLTVASVAIPLSMAIALASDVPVGVGLTTAIIAGIVCALFGGAPLTVSGPTITLAVIVGQIVDKHGLGGLAAAGMIAGGLQIATGVFRLGRFVRMVPVSVIHGFSAGVGVIILIGQLPRALGLPAPDESHVFDVFAHVGQYIGQANGIAVGLAALSFAATFFIPMKFPRMPAALLAVAIPTAIAVALGLDVRSIGQLPRSLPSPVLPGWPSGGLGVLFGDALVVYAIASLETLLSAAALDRLAKGPPHDPDQELIGQGLGNAAAAVFGGIPVTGVIVRSALNAQSGAQTRRAAIFHSLALLVAVLFAAPLMERVPEPALAGVLLAVGLRMAWPATGLELLRASRTDGIVYAVTVVAMVLSGLLAGVQAGCVVAILVALIRIGRAGSDLRKSTRGEPHTISLHGILSFLSIAQLDALKARLDRLDPKVGLVIDLRHVTSVDATAAEHLVAMSAKLEEQGMRVAILGAGAEVQERLLAFGPGADMQARLATTDADVDQLFGRVDPQHARARLLAGVERYRREVVPQLAPLLTRLADGQSPHTLFLTCADSRVQPSLLTSTHPGELFIVRNIGALLPPHGHKTLNDEGAGLEYAIRVLGVRQIVVCGHSKCGAMNALVTGQIPEDLHALRQWCEGSREIAGVAQDTHMVVDDAGRAAMVRQLAHFRSYPVVAEKEKAGELTLTAWFYDLDSADVFEWDPQKLEYRRLETAA